MAMEINKDQLNGKAKTIQSLLYSGESTTVFVSSRDPKAGRKVGKLYSGKQGRFQGKGKLEAG